MYQDKERESEYNVAKRGHKKCVLCEALFMSWSMYSQYTTTLSLSFSSHMRVLLLPSPIRSCGESAQMMMEVSQGVSFSQPRVEMGLQCAICCSAPASLRQAHSSFLLKAKSKSFCRQKYSFGFEEVFFLPKRNKV